jgi:low temperature requirement protein LtrA
MAALQGLTPVLAGTWGPYLFALAWAIVSFLISIQGLHIKGGNGPSQVGTYLRAALVALINSLVLGGAVVGTTIATSQTP